jgi:hypothetical protein
LDPVNEKKNDPTEVHKPAALSLPLRARRTPVKLSLLVGAIGLCAMGCASGPAGMPQTPGVPALRALQGGASPIRAGEARVLDRSISPLVPVHVAPDSGTIAVRFARPRAGALLHLDPQSLLPVSPEEPTPVEERANATRDPAHAVLNGNRFLVCWQQGDVESGYRLMAQAWDADGSPLGPAVAISPPDVDVVGSAQLVALDDDRALATFAAASGDRFELLAVSLQVR